MLQNTARRVLVAANPHSGSRSRDDLLSTLVQQLTVRGLEPAVCTNLDQLQMEIESRYRDGSLRAVIAAGGDGTVSAVASRCHPDVPIAILPLGTENLLSKFVQFPCDPKCIVDSIVQLETRRIDCGAANGKLFLVMVGIGFDAHVVYEMSRSRKGHIRHWSYAKPIWRSVLAYRFPMLKISAFDVHAERHQDQLSKTPPSTTSERSTSEMPMVVPGVAEGQEQVDWHARWVFIANVPRYAANLPIAPWAISDDGMLDICSFRSGGVIPSLGYLAYLAMNRHRSLSSFRTLRAKGVRIEAEEAVSFQVDGDYGGELPLLVEVLPQRLNLVIPQRATP